MKANPILLQKKYSRVVECFANLQGISLDAALDFFYHSEVYQLIRDGISDMHCMSDAYLAEELDLEYRAENDNGLRGNRLKHEKWGNNKQAKRLVNILFVCHGNICRSPMAEFVMKDLVKKAGLEQQFYIASAATSTEEIGNPVHRGTRERLRREGISVAGKTAVQLKRSDYEKYDYLIGMDDWNIRNMLRMLGGDPEGKVHKLLEFAGSGRDVADPWYTGDFEITYRDVMDGCTGLLERILSGKPSQPGQ